MAETYEFVGKDANGIPRVFGAGPNADIAETDCVEAAREYVRRRPETGPLENWTFERAED